jgi:F-type H+-transporting ATPase subunit alpha
MKKVAGKLRLELAQYRELATFAKFGTELDKATQVQLNRGGKLIEILKQAQYQPMPVEDQIIIIWVAVNGYLDNISKERLKEFEEGFLQFVKDKYPQPVEEIRIKEDLSQDLINTLKGIVKEFSDAF